MREVFEQVGTGQHPGRLAARGDHHGRAAAGERGEDLVHRLVGLDRGELIGGADIVEELEQNGELEKTLHEKLGDEYRGDERVVAVA